MSGLSTEKSGEEQEEKKGEKRKKGESVRGAQEEQAPRNRCIQFGMSRRIQEAETYHGEDETNKEKIKAKHRLETCCVAARNMYTEVEAGNEEKAVQDASDTLDKDQLAEKDEFEEKRKEKGEVEEGRQRARQRKERG